MNALKIRTGTLFGAGLLPLAPGTWASLFTLLPVYLVYQLSGGAGVLLLLAVTVLLSLWSAPACIKKYGKDPPQFVMDECAGQTLVFLLAAFNTSLHTNLFLLPAGFFFFRFFDILKPLGIHALQSLKGRYGILADDLLAGVYAMLLLELLHVVAG